MLHFEYGRLITTVITAAYMSYEREKAIDLPDPKVLEELKTYIPLIQQGKDAKVLCKIRKR